jgi:DNA-binding LytR/AlgR family response regulator
MISVIIVDDEPQAHTVLNNHVSRIPKLNLVKNCSNAIEAKDFLSHNQVDLMFLDINMPQLDGFDLLNQLTYPPRVVFTTAYSEFGARSYDYDAVDYLTKPIRFERFEKAVNKAKELIDKGTKEDSLQITEMVLKVDGEFITVPLDNINFIQSFGNYVKVFTNEKTFLTSSTTHEIERLMPRSIFIRVHKSFIVNKNKITSIDLNNIGLGTKMIPIGQTFKRYVFDLLKPNA